MNRLEGLKRHLLEYNIQMLQKKDSLTWQEEADLGRMLRHRENLDIEELDRELNG